MTHETTPPAPTGSIVRRIRDSIQRDPLPPADDRGRMRVVMNSLILHLHPSKVSKPALKFSYTFGLGGLLLLLFTILSITGVLLIFAYTPSPDAAYDSMVALQTEIYFGNLIRNLHHWSGNLMVVVGILHLLRVFFTGGYAPPREFNWVMGLALLLLIVAANFTGYLLPWDQLAYWAVTVGTSLLDYLPWIGEPLTRLLLGGSEVGAATLINFYGLHIALIPLAIAGLVSFHIWRVRKDTITVPKAVGEKASAEKVTTIPHLVSIELVFALVWIALLLVWSAFVNAPLEEAANPAHSPNPAKAAWYFMGFQELLLHFHPLFGAIIVPGLALGALFILPYLNRDMASEGVWFRSVRGRVLTLISFILGVVGTVGFVLLDEAWLDLPGWLPFLPSAISNGWVPLAALLLLIMAYYEGVKLLKSTVCEARQAVFTLLFASFVTLTLVGIFFRGEGMVLIWPWG
ncbi:MAG: cytochrome bc complex cytochrome b subunit [Chloroflexi bacterium]|nr:cytochrome bc complex cytochrome b subunit [Chloroflexota bacterium]MBP8058096.1 cytochrome bc complex cytochrome b subunit [Chloroflexota bacterium]